MPTATIPRRPVKRIDGGDWNAIINRRPGRLELGGDPGSRAGVLTIRNDAVDDSEDPIDLEIYDIVKLGDPIRTPDDNETQFKEGVALIGERPDSAAVPFAVLQEPAKGGDRAEAMVVGVTVVRVKGTGQYADCTNDGGTDYLECGDSGPARVIWSEGGSLERWGVVQLGGIASGDSGGGSTGTPWTIAEYDPTSGEIVNRFDRGRRRGLSTGLADTGLVVHEDDDGKWIYAAGQGHINRSYGVLVKWNLDTGERVWDSTAGVFTGPVHANTTATRGTNRICIADDGFVWVLGSDGTGTGNTCVGRFDPDTGAQTHKYAMASISTSLVRGIFALDSGKILVFPGTPVSGKYLIVLDDTATEDASYTTNIIGDLKVDLANSRIAIVHSTGTDRLRLLDFSLSTLDQRSAPGSEAYGAVETDGTTVWVTTSSGASPMIRAYDASNLATENWNAAQDGGMNPVQRLIYANGALYTFAQRVRKHSVSDGSETWESPSSGFFFPNIITPSSASCAVGTSFVVVITTDTNEQVFCLDDSTGAVNWVDQIGAGHCVTVTDDDRIVIGSARVNP